MLSLASVQNLALAAPAAPGYAGVNPGPVMNEDRPMARRRKSGELVSAEAIFQTPSGISSIRQTASAECEPERGSASSTPSQIA